MSIFPWGKSAPPDSGGANKRSSDTSGFGDSKFGEPLRPRQASAAAQPKVDAFGVIPAQAEPPSERRATPPAQPSSSIVSNIDYLPKFDEFGNVGEKADSFAALLVANTPNGKIAFLAIREDIYSQPTAASLRMILGRDERFSRVQNLRVTASVLSALKTKQTRKVEKAGHGGVEQAELHVARGLEMIGKGIELDASDIHLEVRTTGRDAPSVVIRMRTQGTLTTHLSEKTPEAVTEWIEVIRGLYQNEAIAMASTRTSTTWSASTKQEAMLKPPIKNAEVRFESLPEKGGFDVILRINGYEGKTAARKSLTELGLSDEHARDLLRASLAPHGLIVVVGATGSGKTTTVTTTLTLDEDAESKKRYSLEIPPESDIPWLSQLVVDPENIKQTMDGVMRADPDIISGGEVRNRDTAEMAQDFAITGHLTWVTTHANGLFLAIKRLVSPRLGFDIDILTMRNYLRAVFYQSLMDKLCPSCSLPAEKYMAPERLKLLTTRFELPADKLWVRHVHTTGAGGVKCERCKGTGLIGRVAVVELLVPTPKILALLSNGKFVEAETAWRKTRVARFDEPGTTGKTYVEHAFYKATQREVCANSLFALETLFNYDVIPLEGQTRPSKIVPLTGNISA